MIEPAQESSEIFNRQQIARLFARRVGLIILCVYSLISSSTSLQAQDITQSLSPFRATVRGRLSALNVLYAEFLEQKKLRPQQNREVVKLKRRIPLSIKLPGWAHSIVIEKISPQYWTAEFYNGREYTSDPNLVLLLEGKIVSGKRQAQNFDGRVAGSLSLDRHAPRLKLHYVRQKNSRPLSLSLQASLAQSPSSLRAHMSSARIKNDFFCGLQSHSVLRAAASNHSAPLNFKAASLPGLDLQIHSDPNFTSLHGQSTNADIADIINAVNVIYNRDIGIQFTLSSLVALTGSDPFSGITESTALANAYLNYAAQQGHGNTDISHLFTGKTLDSGVAGIAAFAQTCISRTNSIGLTSDQGSSTYLVTAHELGHNLGADHDTDLMAPSLPVPAQFSDFSINQVSNYLQNFGSCLSSSELPTPTPTPDPGGGGETPTPTSTATPTPTPTSGAGSSGGSSGGTLSPEISMNLTFDNTSGRLEITSNLESLANNCRVDILMEQKQSKIQSAVGQFSYTPSLFLSQTFSAEVNRRVRTSINKQGNKIKPRLFVALRHACEGASAQYSEVIKIALNRIQGKPTKLKKWIKLWSDAARANAS